MYDFIDLNYSGHFYALLNTSPPQYIDYWLNQESIDGMVSGQQLTMISDGPLPPNWEISYTENGEKYFIE